MKYLQRHLINARSFLQYPARNIIWIANEVIFYLIMPFVWLSIIAQKGPIVGYDGSAIITYYILVAAIISAADSKSGSAITTDIVEGGLSKVLVRPVHYLSLTTTFEYVYRIVSFIIIFFVFVPAHFLLPQYITFPSFLNLLIFIPSLILSFFIAHTIQIISGLLAFWFGRNRLITNTIWLGTTLLSGSVAPLDFYPSWIRFIAAHSPFYYMAYFPIAIYQGRLCGSFVITQFIIGLSWILFFSVIIFFLWNNGIKRYEGSGI